MLFLFVQPLFLTEAIAADAASMDNCQSFLMKQSSEPSGELDISVSPLGVKIDNPRKEVVAMLVPPYKVVVLYNVHAKHIYFSSLEKFKGPYAQSLALLHAVTFNELELEPGQPTQYIGLSALKFIMTRDFAILQRSKLSHHEIALNAPASAQCIEATKLKVRPQVLRFVDLYYGLPITAGWPLDFKYFNFRKQFHHYMYTQSIKPTSFKPSDYAIPVGYTQVKDMRELVLDDSSEDSIEMMIGK